MIASSINIPWLSVRDFNDLMVREEKIKGKEKGRRNLEAFQEMMWETKLIGIGFNRPKYMWYNRRDEDDRVKERLNRAPASMMGRKRFP